MMSPGQAWWPRRSTWDRVPVERAAPAHAHVHVPPVTAGQVLELQCERLALEGKGVCLVPPSSFVVLCDRAQPGERLLAQISLVKRGFAEATKLRSLVPPRHAVQPRCPCFGPCGGCTLQNLEYEAQLGEKGRQLEETLRRVGGGVRGLGAALKPPVPCAEVFGYRNKVQFTYSARSWEQAAPEGAASGGDDARPEGLGLAAGGRVADRPALGLLLRGSHDVVVPVPECHLQDDVSNRLLKAVTAEVQRLGLLPYNDASGQGLLKHVVIRSSRGIEAPGHTGSTDSAGSAGGTSGTGRQYLLVLVTTHDAPALLQSLAQAIAEQFPMVVGIVNRVLPAQASEPHANSARRRHASRSQPRFKPFSRSAAATQPGSPAVVWQRAEEAPLPRTPHSVTGATDPVVTTVPPSRSSSHQPAQPTFPGREVPSGGGASAACNTPILTAEVAQGQRHQAASTAASTAAASSSSTAPLAAAASAAHVLHGRPYLEETLCGLTFEVSDESFFQTNTAQAEVLYNMVLEAAQLRPDKSDVVLDLYCGTGTIGLTLARHCKLVVGLDCVGSAVEDARRNARRNGIANARFVCGDASEAARTWGAVGSSSSTSGSRSSTSGSTTTSASSSSTDPGRNRRSGGPKAQSGSNTIDNPRSAVRRGAMPTARGPHATGDDSRPASPGSLSPNPLLPRHIDVAVVDPARAGLSPSVLRLLEACGARRVVYVSCNPATQARDLALLVGARPQRGKQAEREQQPQGPRQEAEAPGKGIQEQQDQEHTALQAGAADAHADGGGGMSRRAQTRSVRASPGPGDQQQPPCFRLLSVQACDMFPHTDHVESVAVLERVW